MPVEIIPKAALILDKEQGGIKWFCPACSYLNWLIACDPDLKSLRRIENVECDSCCCKFETK